MAWACQPSFSTQLPPHSPRSLYTLSCFLITTGILSAQVLKDTISSRALPSAQCLCIKRTDRRGFTLNGANLITKEQWVEQCLSHGFFCFQGSFCLINFYIFLKYGVVPEGLAWDRQVLHVCGQPKPYCDTSFTFSELEFEVWVLGTFLLSGDIVNTVIEHRERFISSH